jgi:glycosyltransferase involved in cell wall biosynthesis
MSAVDAARAPAGRLAVLMSFSGDGGVERMMVNLLQGMAAHGAVIDLLLIKARGTWLAQLPPDIRVIQLGSTHTFLNLPALIRYLRTARPAALLAAKHRALLVALWAQRLSGVRVRVVGRLGTTVSAALERKGRLRHAVWAWTMRRFYPWAATLVAVSQGVADDVRAMGGDEAAARLTVIRNPVVRPALAELARAAPPHPWLAKTDGPPVIIGMGRFTEQKDFATLIRAFARLRANRNCRLILLGRGRLQADYQALAERLGVAADIAYPGFADNPYSYLARARLFVLSSAWEGSPNALTEALALGVPVVATDCPSGPRELLDGGRYGALVTVGDDAALAQAMAATLDAPPPAAGLRRAVADYTVEASARAYLAALGFTT